jgi:hypothetical protein
MAKPKVLIQLDPDKHASSFDALVAVDAGVDRLLQYSNVKPEDVRNIVYGTIFTRKAEDLQHSAFFIGGSDVGVGESLLGEVISAYIGHLRVSVLMDSNGCNTTASAAVVSASRHVQLVQSTALVMAGTGPVGQRIARLLAAHGTSVLLASRSLDRAARVCDSVSQVVSGANLKPVAPATDDELSNLLDGVDLVFCAGAAGVRLLPETVWRRSASLRVAIDLNAVPPLGIEGIKVHDAGTEYDRVICYGAIGVGSTKMKIHREAIRKLFSSNSMVLDVEQVYEIGAMMGP